jgi:DNA-binding protein YbaB
MSGDFGAGLERARQELRELVATASGLEAERPEGYGEAADGMVQVTVVDGRLSNVELNPRALRLASHDLAAAITEAANAALADLESKYPVPSYPTVNVEALEAELAQAQAQSARQMREYQQTIDEALRQIGS